MRIACLYLPGFVIQVHVRSAPHLMGTAFAVVAIGDRDVPRIRAASRHALEAGVRPGMTVTQARAVAAGAKLIDAAPEAYRQARHALGELALGLSVTVDIGDEGAVYALLPPGASGAAFCDKLVGAAARLGFQARAAVADDRFTAWAATQARRDERVQVVPVGGSARYLAPLGLELLGAFIDVDVRKTLGLLGVRTLGDFAALPPPSVGRRWARGAVDAQTLARGLDPRPLQPFMPAEPIRESVELEADVVELEPLAFVMRPLFERAITRLVGRARAVARAALRLRGEGRTTELTVAPSQPTTSARILVDLSRAHLAERRLEHPVKTLEIEVLADGEAVSEALELFPRSVEAVDPAQVDLAVARLAAAFGSEAVFGAELADRYRPEAAWTKRPFAPPQAPAFHKRDSASLRPFHKTDSASLRPFHKTDSASLRPRPGRRKEPPRIVPEVARGGDSVLRLVTPPTAVEVEGADDPLCPPRAVALGGVRHAVAQASGPTRLEGEWWTDSPLARDYFEVATDDGGRYWLYRDHADGRFYLHGVFD